jgi:protein SCO1
LYRIVFCLLILSALSSSPVCVQAADSDEVGLNENLGQMVPLDLTFHDETGSPVRLGDIVDRPTILTLVYYHCSHICPQMLFGLSEVLSKIDLVPGRDYQIITLSFDDTDTPGDARAQKINYIKAINRDFPAVSWKFLTGDKENIKKISDAVGIKYRQVMHGFVHPEVLIFLSPEGKITRYLHVSTSSYGVQYPVLFSPVEFSGALTDASKGVIGARVTKTPLLCFPHEPEQQAKFYRILSVFGMITILAMISLFVYLRVTTKKLPGGKK